MARDTPRLAKLTPPSSAGLVPRPRLFEKLDRLNTGRFAWVSGPGGAGKTSLVASWLAARKHHVIWYQVDSGDRDPATLFHYLGVAAQSLGRGKRNRLPHFTPEYLAGLSDFMRRYFQDFFARLTPPSVLVFDNCQEAGLDSPFQKIVASALNEAPPGVAVVCLGRNEPGEALARWFADPAYVHITGDDLRLDEAEAREIAHERGYRVNAVPELLDSVKGWAAGLILTLRAQTEGVTPVVGLHSAQRAIFDYFAGEILVSADGETRDFLLRSAVLARVTPEVATQLTGYAHAPQLLEELHRNHFFTQRHSPKVGSASYEFHPLFREFLLSRARETFGSEQFGALCVRAANLLEQAGDVEAVIALRIEAHEWPALIQAICAQAPMLMSQGRWQTLTGWIAAVPTEVAANAPWLLYWNGVCSCMTNPLAAQAHFKEAHAQFKGADDAIGALLACAGVLESSYLQLGEQKPALPWIDEINRLLDKSAILPPEIELRVIQGLMGVWMAQPQHPMMWRWAERATELLRALPDARAKAGVIAFVIGYYVWAGEYARVRLVLDDFDLDRKTVERAPLAAISACVFKCGLAWQDAEHDKAYEMMRLAQAAADESGVHVVDTFIAAQGLYTAVSAGDVARAREMLARIRSLLDPRRTLEAHQYESLHAGVLLLEGKIAEALEVARRALPGSEAIGAPFVTATFHLQLAQILLLDNQYEAAHEPLAAVLQFARGMPSRILEFQALMMSAYAWFRSGDEKQGYDALREALAIGQRQNYMNCHPWWIPKIMSFLFSRALEAGIEPEYVRRFIRHRQVEPDNAEVPGWPWPVRVYVLGPFRVLKEDAPLQTGRKAQRRVLELLQAIVALGPREASRERIIEALWPDADGDAARDAFEIALHRLRKLLGDDAVFLDHGQVSLAPKRVWIDAQAFERLADEIQRGPDEGAASAAAFERAVDKALTLYAAHFLANEPERPWMLPARERLRSRLERVVGRAGAHWEEAGALAQARALYQRAIELDPLAEGFYRRLMACHVRAGQNAEALEVYRRCRHMLSVVLGIQPSVETDALRASLVS